MFISKTKFCLLTDLKKNVYKQNNKHLLISEGWLFYYVIKNLLIIKIVYSSNNILKILNKFKLWNYFVNMFISLNCKYVYKV